jgi:hypothetical protein
MIGEWYELFDVARAAGRATMQDLQDMVSTFDPSTLKVPAIIGHSSSYARNSKIPVGAWVDQIKAEGTKLFGTFRLPKIPQTPPPGEFADLQQFTTWFQEAINGGMYDTHSIAFRHENGRARLREVAFLGAQQPAIKGMPKVEFQESDEEEWSYFQSEEELTQIEQEGESSISTMPKNKKTVTRTFSITDFSKLSEEDQAALNEIVDMLLEDYSLGELGTMQQILGAMKAEEANEEEQTEKAAAIGEPFVFSEEVKKGLGDYIALQLKPLADKVKEFEDAAASNTVTAGATTGAGGDAGGASTETQTTSKLTMVTMDAAGATAAATAAKQKLESNQNWIPAWDATLLPIFEAIAPCQLDGNSLLDKLVDALNALPKVNEFMESGISELFDIKEFAEDNRKEKNRTVVNQIPLSKGEQISGADDLIRFEEEAAKSGKSFETVVMEARARGEKV